VIVSRDPKNLMAVAAMHQQSPLLRWLLLVLLVVQTSLMVLLLRYSRTNTSVPYLGSTVVFFTEVVKLVLCLVLLLWQRHCSPALAATVFLNEVKVLLLHCRIDRYKIVPLTFLPISISVFVKNRGKCLYKTFLKGDNLVLYHKKRLNNLTIKNANYKDWRSQKYF